MKRTSLPAAALVVALSATASAQEAPAGRGTLAPNGAVFTTAITPGDVDDYVLPGFPGMKVTVVVKPSKGSTLVPEVLVLHPNGDVATDDEGFLATRKGSGVVATMTLGETGWWKARVRGRVETDLYGNPLPSSTGGYSVQFAYTAPPTKTTLPAASKSFVRSGVIDSRTDVDEITFDAVPGQILDVTLSVPRGGTLWPSFGVFKPSGAPVSFTEFDGRKASSSTTTDQYGAWRVRVAGVERPDDQDPHVNSNTTGAYVLAVKLGKPSERPRLSADGNRQFVFRIPAVGGAKLAWQLNFDFFDAAPTFGSFVDPLGRPVAGFVGRSAFRGALVVDPTPLPAGLPLGDYVLTFDEDDGSAVESFVWKTTLPKAAKRRVAKLSPDEPAIRPLGIDPVAGGPDVVVTVKADRLVDEGAPDGPVGLFLNDVPLEDVERVDDVTVTGRIPDGMPLGTYDVVVTSTSGQAAARAEAFEIVAAPKLTSLDPIRSPEVGGFELTLVGENFRPGQMALVIDGVQQGVEPTYTDATTIRLVAPPHAAGPVSMAVLDVGSRQTSNIRAFTYVVEPAIAKMAPKMVALIAGEIVTITGWNFSPADKVFVETTTPGVYEDLTLTQTTFVDFTHHRFAAPSRPKGKYGVYVEDIQGRPTAKHPETLSYYSYADATATAGLSVGPDGWDAWSSAIADFDLDGKADLFLSRRGGGAASPTSLTRVLKSDAAGHFLDVTSSVMPVVAATEDWRADRVWLADLDRSLDGRPDMVLVTNDSAVLPANASHVRILVNEQRGGASTSPNDRVFRDRTTDLFPAVRVASPYNAPSYVADNWRGLDVWVGDIDKTAGQPEIVITHKEAKQETDVYCPPYCSSPFASFYTYGFYWGGSREFRWDKSKAGGLGRYAFNRDFFPRKSAIRIPFVAPGGGFPICNAAYGQPCVDRFTPFIGKRIAVGDLDWDANGSNLSGLSDVAIVSDDVVQRVYPPSNQLVTISSLQVGLQRFNPSDGALLTDVTHELTALGGDFKADAVAIAKTGYPDGNAYGTIVIAKATSLSAGSLRLLKFKPPTPTTPPRFAAFDDVTSAEMPSFPGNDRFEASQVFFRDTDQDGDPDLVLLAPAAPGGADPALRVLRNEEIGDTKGLFRTSLLQALPPVTASDHFEGDALSIGDVTGDGLVDFVISRAVSSGAGPQTRIVKTDR
jgi:hypothetical protein